MKNCIVYLVRASQEDIESLNKSLQLLSENVLPFLDEQPDIVLFHEPDLKPYVEDIVTLPNTVFEEIEFKVPDFYSDELKKSIPEFFPHPTHGKDGPHGESYFKEHGKYHEGFKMGYRHMCRWFSGELYNHPIMNSYEYYLRLDTDSFILSKLSYDIFEWANLQDCKYGYIAPAVQIDNPKVVESLRATTLKWMNQQQTIYNNLASEPEGKMFYTNFELGYIPWFLSGRGYMDYYKFLDNTGGFYTKRWGDAPIKFEGISMLMRPNHIQPVHGFQYQHGAIYIV